MNNMFEYLAGGQCYTCGGKVRYDEGGYTQDEQQSPIADMGQPMQQPMRQPSTLDANAKQLMRFLLEQLSKGTSERILKKTLIDSGIKSDQATQLLEVAKKEFVKLTEEGDYVNEMSQLQAMQQQQAVAMQQNQMAMSNGQSPMGMNLQQGQDPSQMAMQQGADQSQMADQEMEAQARHGGSMRRLHRFGAGGTCTEGFEWSEMVGSCMPSVSTSNTMQQGSGAMQFGAPQLEEPNAKAGIDSYNQNVLARTQAANTRTQAQGDYYANEIANFNNKRLVEQQNFQTALGGFLPQISPQINTGRDGGNINYLRRKNEGGAYDEYSPIKFDGGGTQGNCPKGYYQGPDNDCLKIFGSNQADAEYQSQVVDFYNRGLALNPNDNRAPMQSKEDFLSQNPAQDQMYANLQNQANVPADTSQAAYQKYVNDYAIANQGKVGAAPALTYDQWKTGTKPTATMPTDPRLTNSPYIVETDKNKIANIDSNWVTRTLAKGNNLGNPQYAGLIGGFNPALKFLLGAGAVLGGAGLGIAKAFAGDRSRVYDDKGNVFHYNSKADEKRALKNGPQTPSQSGYVTPTTSTVPVSGGSNQPTQQQVQQSTIYPPLQSDDPYADNYNPNVPKTIKEDGGEWSPFVDNRRKLRISMPMYGHGGQLDTETSPYSEQEWAAKTGKTVPLDQTGLDAYNNYLNNFSAGSGNTTPANMNTSNMNPNTTNNANNALSANPNANMVDTKEYTIQRGDPLGWKVASNTIQGGIYMSDAKARMNEIKGMQMMQALQQQAGNTMAMGAFNPQGNEGTTNLNPNAGANKYVSSLGYTQDWGTQFGKFGGTTSYRKGGTYEISKEELRRIIEMGGEVEFIN